MNHFELTPDVQTEVESIDELHRNLLRNANRAVSAHIAQQQGRLPSIVEELLNYAQYVFAAEEQLMQSVGFPELAQHRLDHNDLRLEICEVVDASRKQDAVALVRTQLSRVIGTRLMDHFRTYDQRLAAHARQHLKPHEIQLHDSATLIRAGVLVADVQESERITGTDLIQS